MLEIKKGGSNKERKKIRVEESYKGGSLYRAQFIKRNRHAIKNKLASEHALKRVLRGSSIFWVKII